MHGLGHEQDEQDELSVLGLKLQDPGSPVRLARMGTLDLDLRSGLDGYGRRGLGEQVELPAGIQ